MHNSIVIISLYTGCLQVRFCKYTVLCDSLKSAGLYHNKTYYNNSQVLHYGRRVTISGVRVFGCWLGGKARWSAVAGYRWTTKWRGMARSSWARAIKFLLFTGYRTKCAWHTHTHIHVRGFLWRKTADYHIAAMAIIVHTNNNNNL